MYGGYIIILFFCFLSSSICQSCQTVQQCGDDLVVSVGGFSYELNNRSWNSIDNMICPRSEDSIPQWLIFFEDSVSDNKFSSGTFCSNTTFNSSTACVSSTGDLIIYNTESTDFQNSNGVIQFGFTSINDSYSTSLTIRYAKTGVYPANTSIVYFEENQPFITLIWYIYHPEIDPDKKMYYNQQVLSDNTVKLDDSKYGVHEDSLFHCAQASSGETTIYYSLFIMNPTSSSSSGEYVLIVDTHSATITLEPSSLPPSSLSSSSLSSISNIIASSSQHSSSASSSFTTSLMISSEQMQSTTHIFTATVSLSPSPDSNSNHQFPVILPAIFAPLFAILVTIIIVIISILLFKFYHNQRNSNCKEDIEQPPLPPHNNNSAETNNRIYLQQLSQDPSLHKYHLPPLRGNETTAIIEDTTDELKATPPTMAAATTSNEMLSKPTESLNNSNSSLNHQRVHSVNQLRVTVNDLSRSLPTTSQIIKDYNEALLSSSYTKLELLKERKELIKKLCFESVAKRNGPKIGDSSTEIQQVEDLKSSEQINDEGDLWHQTEQEIVNKNQIKIAQDEGCHDDDDDDNESLDMSFEEGFNESLTNIDSESDTNLAESSEKEQYSDNSCSQLVPDPK